MAKQIIESTRQYIPDGVDKSDIGTFVIPGTTTGQAPYPTDFPIRCIPPGSSTNTPAHLAGVLLEVTTQGARVGTKGVFKVKKAASLTTAVPIGSGVLTVNTSGEIATVGATGHGEVKLVSGDDIYIDINLPTQ